MKFLFEYRDDIPTKKSALDAEKSMLDMEQSNIRFLKIDAFT